MGNYNIFSGRSEPLDNDSESPTRSPKDSQRQVELINEQVKDVASKTEFRDEVYRVEPLGREATKQDETTQKEGLSKGARTKEDNEVMEVKEQDGMIQKEGLRKEDAIKQTKENDEVMEVKEGLRKEETITKQTKEDSEAMPETKEQDIMIQKEGLTKGGDVTKQTKGKEDDEVMEVEEQDGMIQNEGLRIEDAITNQVMVANELDNIIKKEKLERSIEDATNQTESTG